MTTGDDRVPALAGALERERKRITQIEADLQAVAQLVAQLSQTGTQNTQLVSTLDQPLSPAAAVDLLDWLGRVYLAYDGAHLPPCWPWHPGVVEELVVLRGAHQTVYASGDRLRVIDWHDRMRPGVARRITEALKACDIEEHLATPATPHAPLSDALSAITQAQTAQTPVPAPTAEQIQQARRLVQSRKSPRRSTAA